MLLSSAAPAQAQLAEQPWPTAAADNQNTSQSVTLRSIEPAIISSVGPVHSPIATGPNGTLYYKEYDGNELYLVSAPPDGGDSPNWRINLTAQGDIADGSEPTSPIVTEEHVYFLAPSENIGTGLYRVDLGGDGLEPVVNSQSGTDPEGGVSDVPAIGNNGRMYVPRQGGAVSFVNIQDATPTIENTVETDGTRVTSPMILDDGRIIVATANGGLFSISPAGDVGSSLIESEGDFVLSPVLNRENVAYLVTTGDPEDIDSPTPQLVAVDITLSEYNVLWTQQIESGVPVGMAAGPDGHLYLTTTGSTGSTIQRRDASTGAQVWAFNVSGTVSPPSIRDSDPSVQVAHQPSNGEGQVLVYAANSVGTELPTIPLSGLQSVNLAPTIAQNADLAVGTDAGLVLTKSTRPTVSPRSVDFGITLTTDTDPAQAGVTINHADTGQRLNINDIFLTGTGSSAFNVANGDDLVSNGIDSNSSATLNLEYGSSVAGTYDATLVISTELYGDFLVTLRGQSIAQGLTGMPDPLVFDTVVLNNTQTKTVEISRTDSNFMIADIRLLDNAFTNDASDEFVVPDEATIVGSNVNAETPFPIDIAFTPTTSGFRSTTLEVETTDGLTLQVTLEGMGLDATLSVTPNPVDFGDVETETSATQTVTLSNTGEDPLPIPSIFTAAPGTNDYTVSGDTFSSVPAGGSETVTVTFLPTVGGTRTGELVIQTDADLEERVPLNGTGVEPDLTLSPDPLTFGTIDLEDAVTETLTIDNPKSVAVAVTDISIDNADFTVTSATSFTVPGNDQATVDIQYDPSATGLAQGTLTVNTDAGFTRDVEVAGEARDVSASVSPTPVEFPGTRQSTTSSVTVTVTNDGSEALTNLSYSLTSNENDEFGVDTNNSTLGSSLDVNSSGTIQLTFTPDNAESNTGSLILNYEAGAISKTETVLLSGTGLEDDTDAMFDISAANPFSNTESGGRSTTQTIQIENDTGSNREITLIDIAGTDPGAFEIEEIRFPDGSVTTGRFEEAYEVSGDGGSNSIVEVDVAFTPPSSGEFGAQLILEVEENLNNSTPLEGTGVEPSLTALPNPLDLSNVAAGATVTEQVTLSNPTSVPVVISSAEVTDADNSTGFSVANPGTVLSTIDADGSVTADITFSSTTIGLDEAVLEVAIDNGGTLQVPLRAQVNEYSLAFAQSPITFASVPVDSSTMETVTLENTGTAALDYAFTGFAGDAGDFAITSGQDTGTLAAGDTRSVIVTFTPQASGMRTADLTAEASLDGTTVATATATLDGIGLEYTSQVSPNSVDFGQVPLGTTSAQDTVIVENSGSAILSIPGLSLPSGSPFNIVSGRGSISLAAGEQLEVVVNFTPQETRFVSTTLEVLTVSGTRTVALNGRGVEKLSSVETLNFPTRLDTEPADTLQAVFTNVNDIDTEFTSISLSGDLSAYSVEIPDPLPTLAPGDSVATPVALTATSPGQYTATLTVDAPTGTTEVTLEGQILPTPELSPDTLRYGQIRAGATVTETLTLRNNHALDLTVEESSRILDDIPGLRITTPLPITIESGQSADLDVAFVPTDPLGDVRATLRLESTLGLEEDNGEEDIEVYSVRQDVPIVAEVVAPPELVVEPEGDIDFGALVAGQTTSAQPVRLINAGGAALTIESAGLAASDSPFLLSETPSGTIAPGDTLAFTITAAPTSVGEFETTFDIDSDGGSARRALRVVSIEVEFQVDDAVLDQPTTARLTLPSFTPTAEQSLYVRPGGASTYEALPLQQTSETEWAVDIPARFATLRGFDYFLVIRDDTYSITLPADTETESRVQPVHARVQFESVNTPRTMPPGAHRMVSVPADIETSDPVEIFGDDYGEFDPRVWRLLRYDPQISDYREAQGLQDIQVGQGLWLATADGEPYDIGPGLSTDASETKTLELLPGWNQIASPFGFPVAWADVQGTDGLESPVVYRGTDYDYSRPVLQPWSGAWVFNPTDQVRAITIPPVAAGSASSAPIAETSAVAPEAGGYTIQLQAQVRSGEQTLRDNANFLGLRKGAVAGLDSLDFAEAPPVGNHVRLSIQDDARRLAGSYRPTGEDGQTWNLELAASTEKTRSGNTETVRLSLVEHGTAPSGYNLYVFDLNRQMPLPVTGGIVDVPVQGDRTTPLRVVAGAESYAKSKSDGIPLEEIETKLGKPYPNPLESEATIEYQLQKTSYVRMELYDILGRRVATLISEEKTAGQHTLQWSPSGNRRLASGVYFLRMRAGDFTATQKMTIVR